MPDQILTQEEIDALLSAMDRGDVDLEQTRGEPEATPYNLTAQNIMLRDQFSNLEEDNDKFAAMDTKEAVVEKSASAILEKIERLALWQRVAIVAGVLVLLCAAAVWFLYLPMYEEITSLEQRFKLWRKNWPPQKSTRPSWKSSR